MPKLSSKNIKCERGCILKTLKYTQDMKNLFSKGIFDLRS